MASQLAAPVLEQLKSLHSGGGAFYFRTELKSPLAPEKKTAWVKMFSAALEKASGRELVNSTSDYEVELRLIEGKNGSFVPLMKLFTLKDTRFSYRKESYAAAMAPVQAAFSWSFPNLGLWMGLRFSIPSVAWELFWWSV